MGGGPGGSGERAEERHLGGVFRSSEGGFEGFEILVI